MEFSFRLLQLPSLAQASPESRDEPESHYGSAEKPFVCEPYKERAKIWYKWFVGVDSLSLQCSISLSPFGVYDYTSTVNVLVKPQAATA